MRHNTKDFEKLVLCKCLEHQDREIEDLVDADLCDPECPIHGVGAKIVEG